MTKKQINVRVSMRNTGKNTPNIAKGGNPTSTDKGTPNIQK